MRLPWIVGFALLAGCMHLNGPPLESREWNVDNLERIGGVRPEVIGHPRVIVEDGAGAVCFDGKADGLLLAENPVQGMQQFTIEARIKPGAEGPAEQRFLHIEDERGRRALLETRMAGRTWALDTFLRSSDADKLTLLDRARTQPADRWHWVALVYDGTMMSHHVDGAKQLEGQVVFPPMSSGRTSLGVRQNRVHWFKGCISHLRFTPRALSARELRRIG